MPLELRRHSARTTRRRTGIGFGLAVAIALAATLSLVPRTADACGGSDSGSSSSSSGSSSDSSSSSYCDFSATSDYDTSYGDSDTEVEPLDTPLITELGVSLRDLTIDRFVFEGSSNHFGTTYSFAVAAADARAAKSSSSALLTEAYLEISGIVFDYLELGGGLMAGGGSLDGVGVVSDDLEVDVQRIVSLGGFASVGARFPLGPVSLWGDVRLGMRELIMHMETRYGTCVNDVTTYDTMGIVEPRIGLDIWIAPWLTAGGYAGMDVLEPMTFTGGVGLAVHLLPYDQPAQ